MSSGPASQLPIYFEPKSIGRSFTSVSVDLVQTESHEILSKWWHSDKEADLFVWVDNQKNIIKQQVCFCGQVVEWNILEGVKTGVIYEREENAQVESLESLYFDSKPQPASIQIAVELIRYIEDMNEDERKYLIENFTDSPTLSNLQPEEFLKRYGKVEPVEVSTPRFWQRVIQHIRRLFRL